MEFQVLPVAIFFFILGNITGFFIHNLIDGKYFDFGSEARINWLILVVSLVWIFSVIIDILSPAYETSPLIHGIMGAIVGFFFWRPKTQ